jgi:hypothetical protein
MHMHVPLAGVLQGLRLSFFCMSHFAVHMHLGTRRAAGAIVCILGFAAG